MYLKENYDRKKKDVEIADISKKADFSPSKKPKKHHHIMVESPTSIKDGLFKPSYNLKLDK